MLLKEEETASLVHMFRQGQCRAMRVAVGGETGLEWEGSITR